MQKLNVLQLGRISVDEYKSSEKLPLVVILDNVRSMYNVGSVFRTSDAFRVEKICLCGITPVPPHQEIHKTALGAEESVEWEHYDSTIDAVHQLKKQGYIIYGVEQCEGSILLDERRETKDESDDAKKYAIILGHEVKGVDQAVIDECDGCLEIPQYGTKHSLNVSTAAGIVIWELSLWLRKK